MKSGNGKLNASEVVKLLEASRTELEHYRKALADNQTALAEHLENLRKELSDSLTEMRAVFADTKVLTIETSGRLMARVQSLQEILTHIPGSEPALIKNWLLAIKRTLSGMIRDLGGESVFSGALARLVDRVHRLKIKVDILRLRLKLGAMDIRDAVVDTKNSFREKMAKITTYATQKEEMIGRRLSHFRKEVSEAYDHLSKALSAR
jgi:predicted  nucleic acid-binding Zn-ribbon protein